MSRGKELPKSREKLQENLSQEEGVGSRGLLHCWGGSRCVGMRNKEVQAAEFGCEEQNRSCEVKEWVFLFLFVS